MHPSEIDALWLRYTRHRAAADRAALSVYYRPLIVGSIHIVVHRLPAGMDRADVRQELAVMLDRLIASCRVVTDGGFRKYAGVCLRGRVRDLIRKHLRAAQVEREAAGARERDDMGAVLETRDMEAALSVLPEPEREILRLRYWEGADFAAIGARFGHSGSWAWRRQDRALGVLRKRLAQ